MKKNNYKIILGAVIIIYLLKKYGMDAIKKAQELVKAIAIKYEGIKEIGVNQGFNDVNFQKKMSNAGWSSGQQWCAYFAKLVHLEAFPDSANNIRKILNGNTQKLFNNAKNDTTGTYTVIMAGKPMPGDIAIWVRTKNASKGHAGIVINSNDDFFETIEGNTDMQGSAVGQGVLKQKRPLKYNQNIPNSGLKLRGFVRKITK